MAREAQRSGRRTVAGVHEAGFTYIGLLIAVVVLGIGLAMVGVVWRTVAQREREQELLFIGHEFRAAIASYYAAAAEGGHSYPREVADLLEDRRWPEPHHHLRRLYADPMTGLADWTFIRDDALGITGIASSSHAEPLKKKGFGTNDSLFEDATCYCDWQFIFVPRNIRRRPTAAPHVINN